jgi:hypothetical protein
MKPDRKICRNCGKEIDGKKTYCDDACRMAFKRNKPEHLDNPNTNKAEQNEPEQAESEQPEQMRDFLTKTDKTFYDRAMLDFGEPYYNFLEKPVYSATCLRCRNKFKTTLGMLRFCSYQHYSASLSGRKD